MKIQTILVPTDFSTHAEKALDAAIEFAKVFGARLELLHAYDFDRWVSLYELTFAEEVSAQMQAAAANKIAPCVERATSEGVEASAQVVFGAPSEVIRDRATEGGVDLIVMGTRGLGALEHVLLGSVAERTVRMAPCPVLTVPPHVND